MGGLDTYAPVPSSDDDAVFMPLFKHCHQLLRQAAFFTKPSCLALALLAVTGKAFRLPLPLSLPLPLATAAVRIIRLISSTRNYHGGDLRKHLSWRFDFKAVNLTTSL